ncbi:unnamed protein product [Haemonchus placei]|uniref:DUF148 domain-containing protein n=1 Tax=Haemonchus placei TaxID=6290 RepID=A0A0N4WFZ2_HAEPC|nr:unnamed protein product [Haemonchus placei]
MKTVLVILAVAGSVLCAPSDPNVLVDPPNERIRGDHKGSVGSDENDIQGGPRSYGDHTGHPHHGPPPPPYLGNVSDEARQEYFTIVSNMNNSIGQQKKDILAWAQKNGVEAQVQEFNNNMTLLETQVKQNVTNVINSLPSALQQVLSIAGNETLTPEEARNARKELMTQNPQVYSIIRLVMANFHSRAAFQRDGPPNFAATVVRGPEGGSQPGVMILDEEDDDL